MKANKLSQSCLRYKRGLTLPNVLDPLKHMFMIEAKCIASDVKAYSCLSMWGYFNLLKSISKEIEEPVRKTFAGRGTKQAEDCFRSNPIKCVVCCMFWWKCWNKICLTKHGHIRNLHSLIDAFAALVQNHRVLYACNLIRSFIQVVRIMSRRRSHRTACITETCLFKYTENFTLKKMKIFRWKIPTILHIFDSNIDCGYSLEPPRRGGSNEYPQSMFWRRNKKNNVYPCKPQFYYIKVGFKGVKII